MKQQIFKWTLCYCGALTLCLGIQSQALEFDYQTFLIPSSQATLLNATNNQAISNNHSSSVLFVAKTKQGILFAGNSALGRCTPLIEKDLQTQDSNALKDGMLQCKNLALKVEDNSITRAITATKNSKLNLKLINSITLEQQEITYQYPKSKTDSTTHASVSTQFYCSKDSKIQEMLQTLYQTKYNCKNAQAVFLSQAQDSMQKSLEEFQQETNLTSKENAIDEFLKTSSFEQYTGDSLYYFDENLLAFLTTHYLYTGGAHGISNTSGVILSKNNEIIDLEKIIDFNNPELKSLLWEAYQNYLQTIEMKESYTDFESFEVSKVVLLDYDSFVFIYQPYEIMPYAYGSVKLKIPLAQMAKFGDFATTPLQSLFAK